MENNFFENYIHPEDREKVVADFKKGMMEKKAISNTFRLSDSEGNIHWLENYPHFQNDKDDNSAAMIGVIRDVTRHKIAEDELKKYRTRLEELVELRTSEPEEADKSYSTEKKNYEKAIREKEAKIRSVFLATPVGIGVIWDRVFKDVNDKMCELVGYTREEIVGVNTRFLYPSEEEYDRLGNLLEGLVRNKEPLEAQGKWKCKDGKIIDVAFTFALIDPKNPTSGITFTVSDITEKLLADEKICNLTQFQQTVIENADIWLNVLNDNAEVVIWNNAAEKISGYSREEVIGTTKVWDLLYPDQEYRNEILAEAKAILEEGKRVAGFETTITRKDGEERTISWNSRNLVNENREVIGSIAIGNDVTQRKEAERVQKTYVHFLQELIDAIPIPVFYVNKDGTCLGCNKALEHFIGIKKEDLVGKTVFELAPEDLATEYYEKDNELFEKGGIQTYESWTESITDGSRRRVVFNKSLFTDLNGDKAGLVGAIIDVTEIKENEEMLRKYAKQLEHSNELKGIFTDILSHDLMNHAAVIDGYTCLLIAGEDEENKLLKLEKIDNTNKKLIELIDCVAAFAKLESMDEINSEPMDIGKILKDCLSHFEYQAAQKNMKIVLEPKGKYNALVNPMIEEVFANLISNAVKYGPENGNIRIDVKDQDEHWKVTVTDSGQGIAEKDKTLIFDRFKRAVGDCRIKGSGLGLAIVKRIVELHGGEVGVEDNPDGGGSVFWVTLKKA